MPLMVYPPASDFSHLPL